MLEAIKDFLVASGFHCTMNVDVYGVADVGSKMISVYVRRHNVDITLRGDHLHILSYRWFTLDLADPDCFEKLKRIVHEGIG